MTEPIDRSPTPVSAVASFSMGVLGAVAGGMYSWPALTVGSVGVVLLIGGLVRGSRSAVTVAAGAIFTGAIVAAYDGAPVGMVLASVTAAVLAWDAGGTAISIGSQLGRRGSTVRIEAVHLVASTAVGCLTVGIAYLGYERATGGQPLSALLLLLLAVILLLTAVQIAERSADESASGR